MSAITGVPVGFKVLYECRGIEDYTITHQHQKNLLQKVIAGDLPSCLISVVHYPVITIGRKGDRTDIIASDDILHEKGIEVIEVERGGQVTYHGPEQLVLYPILDLRQFTKDVSWYLRMLERVIIKTLRKYNIQAEKGAEAGVFVQGRKIGSIGVAVKRWVTYHGLSINVKRDDNFNLINPCGISPGTITSIEEECSEIEIVDVEREAVRVFGEEFETRLIQDSMF